MGDQPVPTLIHYIANRYFMYNGMHPSSDPHVDVTDPAALASPCPASALVRRSSLVPGVTPACTPGRVPRGVHAPHQPLRSGGHPNVVASLEQCAQ